ncbi:MAG: sugar phosphate nucleotidyltransferase [Candidatus Sumerlaeia bacterium]
MKVVLFCGGKGMRLRDYSEQIPKPMICIGYRPVLWHVMKYYAHFGHTDFILCLGYKADYIKNYFLNYNECLSNDFVLRPGGGEQVHLLNRDIDNWTITFIDTGMETNIGGRLRMVRRYVQDEPMFLANYSDALTDLDLRLMIRDFQRRPESVASFLCVRPCTSFHLVQFDAKSQVTAIRDVHQSDVWINGGFFAMRPEIFDYMNEGEELVAEPFQRLIDEKRLHAFHYERFWQCMDTFKDKQEFEDMYSHGRAPWELWKNGSGTHTPSELLNVRSAAE